VLFIACVCLDQDLKNILNSLFGFIHLLFFLFQLRLNPTFLLLNVFMTKCVKDLTIVLFFSFPMFPSLGFGECTLNKNVSVPLNGLC